MTSSDTQKWKVRRDSVDPLTTTIPGPWRVESPRGIELYRTHSQRSAFELAGCFASLEQLLVRVNALQIALAPSQLDDPEDRAAEEELHRRYVAAGGDYSDGGPDPREFGTLAVVR